MLAVDPGTKRCGVALAASRTMFTGEILFPMDFHEQLPTYEEFKNEIRYSRAGRVIYQHLTVLPTPHSHLQCAHAFIERSSRKRIKFDRIHGHVLPSNHVINQKMTHYWGKLIAELSPHIIVQKIDADKWANLLVSKYGRGRLASDEFESLKRREASKLVGTDIRSPHITDAILLLSYGVDTLIAEFAR